MRTIEVDCVVMGCGIVGSYIAARLYERGLRVALVDCAPAPGSAPVRPQPEVIAGSRTHQGIVDARHHELGGNSAYWGGAMLRIPPADLTGIVDTRTITPEALGRAYEKVERVLGMPGPTRRAPAGPEAGNVPGATRTDACVLPARSKHFFNSMVLPHLSSYSTLFDASIDAVEVRDGTLTSVTVTQTGGTRMQIRATRFFLTMGVIDSLLFARRYESALFGTVSPSLCHYLHEHISVPLFQVKADRRGDFLREWVPHFAGPFMNVPRIEFPLQGEWNPRAFVHFVFDFDSVGVYHDIKRVMAARQAGASLRTLAGKALGLTPRAFEIARIGIDRYLSNRLYVSDDVPVTAVLDFESYPHGDNRLETAPPAMHWNIRSEDKYAFRCLAPLATAIVHSLAERHGFDPAPLTHMEDAYALDSHLLAEGKDILHLGGGLQCAGPNQVLEPDLSFPGARNLWAVSTAVLARGSVANPTHSLLALAQWRLDRP